MVEQVIDIEQTSNSCVTDIESCSKEEVEIQKPHLFPVPKSQDGWTLYGDQDCPFCHKSKDLLIGMSAKFKYINTVEHGGRTKTLDSLSKLTNNQRTVPVIFHKGEFVGGYREMIQKLVGIIRSCN